MFLLHSKHAQAGQDEPATENPSFLHPPLNPQWQIEWQRGMSEGSTVRGRDSAVGVSESGGGILFWQMAK